MAQFIEDLFDVTITEFTLSRVLQREKISRKKIKFFNLCTPSILLKVIASTHCKRAKSRTQNSLAEANDRMNSGAIALS